MKFNAVKLRPAIKNLEKLLMMTNHNYISK